MIETPGDLIIRSKILINGPNQSDSNLGNYFPLAGPASFAIARK